MRFGNFRVENALDSDLDIELLESVNVFLKSFGNGSVAKLYSDAVVGFRRWLRHQEQGRDFLVNKVVAAFGVLFIYLQRGRDPKEMLRLVDASDTEHARALTRENDLASARCRGVVPILTTRLFRARRQTQAGPQTLWDAPGSTLYWDRHWASETERQSGLGRDTDVPLARECSACRSCAGAYRASDQRADTATSNSADYGANSCAAPDQDAVALVVILSGPAEISRGDFVGFSVYFD